jgi:hypothetical protein
LPIGAHHARVGLDAAERDEQQEGAGRERERDDNT